MAKINPGALFIQLQSAEPILVRAATQVAKEEIFEKNVKAMIEEFDKHVVTREIEAGIDAPNFSKTLIGPSKPEGRNLASFIGFPEGTEENETAAIRAFLNPDHPDGPKIKYIRGSQRGNLTFQFAITPPNKAAIYEATPMPWGTGLSWAERIELGMPGLNRFLNKKGMRNSRSGGGIQVKRNIRQARFANRPYLSKIFGNFLARF